jgi:hypothetical protein
VVNVVIAGVRFVALALLLQILKKPLTTWWQRGGMWGFERNSEQAEENHRFATRWCLVGGVGLMLVGLGSALLEAFTR